MPYGVSHGRPFVFGVIMVAPRVTTCNNLLYEVLAAFSKIFQKIEGTSSVIRN